MKPLKRIRLTGKPAPKTPTAGARTPNPMANMPNAKTPQASAKTPAASAAKGPTGSAAKTPAASAVKGQTASAAKTPAASAVKRPTASAAKGPTASAAKTPTASAAKRPTASAAKTPTASAVKGPTASAAKTPAASAVKRPTAPAAKTPTASSTRTPAASAGRTPAASAARTPAASAARTPAASASTRPTASAARKTAPAGKTLTARKTGSPRAGTLQAANGLRDLFEVGLKDIYYAEQVLAKSLPKMAKNATSPELVNELNNHLAVTKEQVSRLEQIFKSTGIKAQAVKCDAMDGLLKETDNIMQIAAKGNVRDACIISSDQKVDHYEIAAFGTLHAYAKTLGEHEAANLLSLTLDEAKKVDAALTRLAMTGINSQAWKADAITAYKKK